MQRIWSRGASAAPASHCISCLSAVAAGTTPQAASRQLERSPQIRDPVTALHTSFFAAALTNARAKGKRRREWTEKFTAIKDEVNELLDVEQCRWDALASRRGSNASRRTLQARSYHTSRDMRQPGQWDQSPSNRPPAKHPNQLETEAPVLKELEAQTLQPLDEEDDFDMAIDVEQTPDWLLTDPDRAKAIKRLAIKQLAIRILIRPAVAHSYLGVLKNYDADGNYPQLDLANLLFELNAARRRIRQIKANPDVNIDDLMKYVTRQGSYAAREDQRRDASIRRDTNLYLSGEMPLEELLLRLSNWLLKSHDPDRTSAFTMMIHTFTKSRQNDLAALVIKTILPYRFEMNNTLILAVINFFRKSKDLKSFDLFLRMLEGKGYPVNLGNLGYYRTKRVNGLEISCPPVHSANIVVYAALIKACLRFDQPDRADAYLQVARAAGCMDDFAILMAYLEFYTIRKDWEQGRQLLQRCLAFVISSSQHPQERVERLIVMMTHLCDECGMLEVAEGLIRSAIHAGFSPAIPRQQEDVISNTDPDFLRWTNAAEKALPQTDRRLIDKYYVFVRDAREQLDILDPPRTPHARRLTRLMGLYSDQLLSTMVESRPGQEIKQEKQPQESEGANDDQPLENQLNTQDPASLLESTISTQQREIGALKHEVAELKQLVLRLYQLPADPSRHGTAENRLRRLKSRHASSMKELENQPHDERAGSVGS
ncbi:hypothetical protein BDV18DRAFT_147271 [Aspergillus unguis]